jgi:hypothetical protein
MSLIVPPWGWAYGVNNLTGTPAAGNYGAAVTAGANNADGTAVSLLSATTGDIHYLIVGVAGFNATGVASNVLVDILQDPAGGTAWAPLIDDLLAGYLTTMDAGVGFSLWYHFPLWVKSGTSFAAWARTSHTSTIAGRVAIKAFGEPSRPDAWWCGQKVETLGVTAASSIGTSVTPGDSGTYGSWTTIGTSTARYGAVQMGVQGPDASATALGYYWQLGYGSAQMPAAPTWESSTSTNEGGKREFQHWLPCDVPDGTAWQARGTASGASAEVQQVAVYGVAA